MIRTLFTLTMGLTLIASPFARAVFESGGRGGHASPLGAPADASSNDYLTIKLLGRADWTNFHLPSLTV